MYNNQYVRQTWPRLPLSHYATPILPLLGPASSHIQVHSLSHYEGKVKRLVHRTPPPDSAPYWHGIVQEHRSDCLGVRTGVE